MTLCLNKKTEPIPFKKRRAHNMTFQSRAPEQGSGIVCFVLSYLWCKKAQDHTRRPVFDALLLAALQHRVGFSTGNMRRHDARKSVLPYDIAAAVYALLPPMETKGPKKTKLLVLVSLRGLGQMNSKPEAQ